MHRPTTNDSTNNGIRPEDTHQRSEKPRQSVRRASTVSRVPSNCGIDLLLWGCRCTSPDHMAGHKPSVGRDVEHRTHAAENHFQWLIPVLLNLCRLAHLLCTSLSFYILYACQWHIVSRYCRLVQYMYKFFFCSFDAITFNFPVMLFFFFFFFFFGIAVEPRQVAFTLQINSFITRMLKGYSR